MQFMPSIIPIPKFPLLFQKKFPHNVHVPTSDSVSKSDGIVHCKMLLFCANTVVRESAKFELASPSEFKKEEENTAVWRLSGAVLSRRFFTTLGVFMQAALRRGSNRVGARTGQSARLEPSFFANAANITYKIIWPQC